mmetsp:Transcript_23376/g.59840  ORF Transcript_23376/g.59840 Transcript_23376/m.59840 type:complete len:280 (-) Transcript_23376:537-1376(-)
MLGQRLMQGSQTRAAQRPFTARAPRMVAPKRQLRVNVSASAAAQTTSFRETPLVNVMEKGEMSQFPAAPGVYAVFDKSNTLQYIGLSRRVDTSVANHMTELPELTHAIKFLAVSHATRESLTAAWKAWVEEAVAETGTIPPGNAPGETKWQSRTAKPARPEIRLTNGKAINVPIETLIEQVVKDVKCVAFIKGTRTQPQCGFSHKMLTILNTLKAEYEVVNVLDEVYNPGLREAIKNYSQWPTIPQLYIGGEFVGGSDICEEMMNSGDLAKIVPRKADA